MYQIAIILNNTEANVSLSFKTNESAEAVYTRITSDKAGEFLLEDDFGYKLYLHFSSISYVLFIDIEQSQFCQHERNLATARAAKKLAENMDLDQAELLGMVPNQRPKSQIIQ